MFPKNEPNDLRNGMRTNAETVHLVSMVSKNLKSFVLSLTDILFSPNRLALLLLDIALCFGAFYAAMQLSPYGQLNPEKSKMLMSATIFTVTFCSCAMGLGYYERTRRYSLYKVFTNGLAATAIALVVSITALYLLYYSVFGRLTFLWGAIGAYSVVTLFRICLAIIYRYIPYRYSQIGASRMLDEVKNYLSDPAAEEGRYFNYVDWANRKPHAAIADLVFAKDALDTPDGVNMAVQAIKEKVRIIDENDFYASIFERVDLDGISKSWIINKGLHTRRLATHFMMRLFDIGVAGCALIMAGPLLALIALIIKLTSPGPVLFIQPRQGRFCKPFDMYKFRTMHAAVSFEDARGGFTKAGDARVTGIGRIIRPLHLDELPQLINILKGDMSIVGPRPEAVPFAQRMAKEIDLYEMRYLVRPGLTGHAQIMSGYCMDTVEDTKKKLSYDLYYLCNYNIFTNLRIIVRTFFVVLKQAIHAAKSVEKKTAVDTI
jgi:lipopolysaccharide/colanic/teichoic acid biosynthesis glycosyltransferase/uncharacterized membrane protein YidH (DUF202 family)